MPDALQHDVLYLSVQVPQGVYVGLFGRKLSTAPGEWADKTRLIVASTLCDLPREQLVEMDVVDVLESATWQLAKREALVRLARMYVDEDDVLEIAFAGQELNDDEWARIQLHSGTPIPADAWEKLAEDILSISRAVVNPRYPRDARVYLAREFWKDQEVLRVSERDQLIFTVMLNALIHTLASSRNKFPSDRDWGHTVRYTLELVAMWAWVISTRDSD